MMGVPNSLPPVPQTYTEWAAAERALWPAAEVSQRADFWRSQLKGSRQIWSRADGTPHAHEPLQRWISNIPANLTRAVKELTRKESATLFSTLLAAFQVALGKWANRDDIVVGTPVANRNKASAKQTMGYFAGVVPLRGQVDPSRAFSDHLRAVHETAINAFGNAMPFAELATALGEPQAKGLHSIFDVRFALQNHPTPDVVLPRISTKLRMRSTGTARFDLGCEITETGSDMELVWLFKPGLFPRADITALDALFLSVLSQVCKNPGNQNSTLIV
jgi:non-ribosomal peptide synthetase component F